MEQLKVPIGADTKNLEKGLNEASKALKAFATQAGQISNKLKKNAIDSSKLGGEINKLNADFKKGTISESAFGRGMVSLTNKEKVLSASSKKLRLDLIKLNKAKKDLGSGSALAAKGMKNLKGQTINGNAAMTSFSRTIQDAPFGIMGVSNNITNLTEQFGYLKNKTGSAKGALQAMLRDLKGFGGISLAVSVVTSLMLVFGDRLFKTRDKAKELRDEQEKLTKSLEDYVTALDDVSRANLKGSQSAIKEATTLKLLRKSAEDTTMSMVDRIKAVNELQKLYPDYLGNIKDEKILNGDVSKTFATLTANILKRAKATAALNIIIKNSEELLTLESQAAEKKNEIDKKAIQKTNAYTLAQARNGKERAGLNAANQRALKIQSEYNTLIKESKILEGKIKGIQLKNVDLEKAIDDVGGIPVTITPKFDTSKRVKLVPFNITPLDTTFYDEELNEWKNRTIAKFGAIEGRGLDWSAAFNAKQLAEQALLIQNQLLKLNQDSKNIIGGSMISTFSGIGLAIGNALSEGADVFKSVSQALLKGLGGLLSSMGDYLIQAGTAAVLAGTVLSLFGSIAGIGAGFAAIAGGVLLKGVGGGLSGFSGAGSDGDSSSVGSNYSSPSSNNGSDRGSSNSGGTVVFEIAGTKLIGVLTNTLNRNKSLGGSLTIT